MLLTMLNLINVTDNVKFDKFVTDKLLLLTMLNLITVTDNVKFDKCY